MTCCHHHALQLTPGNETAFSVDVAAITFGPNCLREAGDRATQLGLKRVAVFTDAHLIACGHVAPVLESLKTAGIDVAVFADCRCEPTDASWASAIQFATSGNFDGYVSVGGGSVMDTAKAANLYATHPAPLTRYVNAPIGEGAAVPGPIKPHIACPTSSGTGAECTGIAIFDYLAHGVKTGIASPRLRPTLALIDPTTTYSLPSAVVAASGFDVLSHALESYTALPFHGRAAPDRPSLRPVSQGANPWSDVGCEQSLRLCGRYFERAVADASDHEARDGMMWAATLAGIAFGNAGVHLPHGMSYAVAGGVREFVPEGYDTHEPMVPHGMSVIVNAPAVFRHTASACPDRHLAAFNWLRGDAHDLTLADAGEALATHLIGLMQRTRMPNGIGGVGYDTSDLAALAQGAWAQQRLIRNAPCAVTEMVLTDLFRSALRYW